MLSGIQYEVSQSRHLGRALTDADLGSPYGRVRCMLTDLKFDPTYIEMQDGNASFLAPGTVIYRVNGYAPFFRLAAQREGQLLLYESDVNRAAAHGGELLDLAGKVSSISIDRDTADGVTQIAAISDSTQIDRLVAMVLAAPVDQRSEAGHAGGRFFVIFNLKDGTVVRRAYFRDSGVLSRGILTPLGFRWAIEQAAAGAA